VTAAAVLRTAADWFEAGAIMTLMSHGRLSEKKRRLPLGIILLVGLDAAVRGAGLLLPGSAAAEQTLQAVQATSHRAQGAPVAYILFFMESMPSCYDLCLGLLKLVAGVSLLMTELTSRAMSRVASFAVDKEAEAEMAELERRVAEQDAEESKSKDSKQGSNAKGTSSATGTKAGGASQQQKNTIGADAQMGQYLVTKLLVVSLVLVAGAATARGVQSLPRAVKPNSLRDFIQILPRALPPRFGLLSLLTDSALALSPRAWLAPSKSTDSLGTTMAGHSLLLRFVGALFFIAAWALDAGDDPLRFVEQAPPAVQGHMVVVAATVLALLVSVVGRAAYSQPILCSVVLNLFPVALGIVLKPDTTSSDLQDYRRILLYLVSVTYTMALLFGGTTSIAAAVITASVVINMHVSAQG